MSSERIIRVRRGHRLCSSLFNVALYDHFMQHSEHTVFYTSKQRILFSQNATAQSLSLEVRARGQLSEDQCRDQRIIHGA